MSKKRRETISVVLIVKDEEKVLEECLESVRWADEIVVYDTGSTDQTREIARRYTDIVVDGYWDDDFSAARNRALEHATGDWVLSIDADEVFESHGGTLRKRLAEATMTTYGVRIVNTGASSVAPTFEFTAKRVFRREGHRWTGRLHEQIAGPDGRMAVGGLLGGIRLRHSGYADAARLQHEKADRNIALSRDQLAEARAADDPSEIAMALVHLARSLTMGSDAEARAVAEEAWKLADHLTDQVAQALCVTEYRRHLEADDTAGALAWVERWRSVQPHNAEVDIAEAEVHEHAGDIDAGLAAIDRVPRVSRDGAGGELRRSSAINLETSLLAGAGRADEALALVREALRTGDGDPRPTVVAVRLGEEALCSLFDDLADQRWRRWTFLCVADSTRQSLRILELMDAHRPGDAAVLAAAARVAPRHGLEAAADWDLRLRTHGLGRLSALVTLAADSRAQPGDRALAAALAISAYHDDRALPHLADALDHVPAQRQAEVAQALEIVAPGLVSLD